MLLNTRCVSSLQLTALVTTSAEENLDTLLHRLTPSIDEAIAKLDYLAALKSLAQLQNAIDQFFEQVMVLTEEPKIRHNRLALLAKLAQAMNQIADLTYLSLNT